MKISKEELSQYPPIPLNNSIDLTGIKQNRLLALYRVNKPKNLKTPGVYWLCQCDCGNYAIVLAKSFLQQKTKSCGCLAIETSREAMKKIQQNNPQPWNKKDLTGQVIGEWTVLGLDETGGDEHHRKWLCQCSCGKIASVFGCNLGRISFSCGHAKNKSIGENKIIQLLTENKIAFETQKVMFKYGVHGNAKFDFYVDNKYLIEYDGTTHYIPIGGWNNEEAVLKTQERDIIKNQWCREHNIPLIRIPYTHLKDLCIEDLLLETTNFLVTSTKETENE